MRSAEYWRKRSEEVAARQFAKADAYQAELAREYARATEEIYRAIEVFYQRYAANSEVSMADARRQLSGKELRQFKMTLEEFTAKAKDNADGRWTKQLNEVYYRVRVSRYEALLTEIQQQVEMLAGSRQDGLRKLLEDVYEDTYYRTIYELQRGTGFGVTFAKIDRDTLETVLGTEFAGSNWSKRIWNDRDKLVTELRTKLAQAFIRGEPAERTARDLAERMGVSLSTAERLVQTETAFFVGEATAAGYKASGVVQKYEYLATLDSRTTEICRSMDGRVFNLSEREVGVNYPPLHVRCRSTVVPYFDDEIDHGERIARDDEGKTYYVSGDMTYSEWAEKHAPEAIKPPKTEEPKPVEPPTVTTVAPSLQPPRPTPPKELRSPEEREKDRVFTSQEDVDAWIDDVTPKWLVELTQEEMAAIRKYTSSYYEVANSALRSLDPSDETVKFTEKVAGALSKFSLTESIVVWRGLEVNIFGTDDPKQLIGSEYDDPGFFSTSLLRETAFKGQVLMIVHLPAGSAGAPIVYMSQFPEENEFLLPPGAHYVILDAWKEDGVLIVVVEVIDE